MELFELASFFMEHHLSLKELADYDYSYLSTWHILSQMNEVIVFVASDKIHAFKIRILANLCLSL